jgi:hypothetical protein
MSPDAALAGRLRAELGDLAGVVKRAGALAAKARERGDPDYLDGVALNLHGFYAGAERLFEEIARQIDESVPEGPEGHRDLLVQMSADVQGTRPAVLSRESRKCLDEYRGLRHIVRNVYAFNLRPSRLYELVDGLEDCHALLCRDVEAFCAFLESLE